MRKNILIIITQMILVIFPVSAQDKIVMVDNELFKEQLLSNGLCRGYSLVEYRVDGIGELELLKTYSLPDDGNCNGKSLISFNQNIANYPVELFFQIIDSVFFELDYKTSIIIEGVENFKGLCKNQACPLSSRDINTVYYNPYKNIYEMHFSLKGRVYVSRIHAGKAKLENIEIKRIM